MVYLQPVNIPRVRSLWLQEALAVEPDAERVEPLVGSHATDVCIVGGGYTGLWTALRIRDLDPAIRVTILEADVCGAGASGRNGGMALPWWTKAKRLLRVCGEDEGRFLLRESVKAIDEIAAFCAEYGVDAKMRRDGQLQLATTPLHLDSWRENLDLVDSLGMGTPIEPLSAEDAARQGGSTTYVGGIFERHGATVQPALLARGLRRVALERGVAIYEKTPVVRIGEGHPVRLHTPSGEVVADKVVLATNAWSAAIPELRRHMIVVSSDMVATAPIPDRLREIGWTGGESISDCRLMVHYLHVTHDARIAIGRGSGALAYLGRVTPVFDDSVTRARTVVDGMHKLYPALADVPISHRWAGPIDRSRSGTLIFGRLKLNPNIHYGIGYSGTGVAQTVMGGKILASSVLERVDEWSTSRLNQGPVVLYPPDPVRFFGGLVVRGVLSRTEEQEENGLVPSAWAKRFSKIAYPYVPNRADRLLGASTPSKAEPGLRP